MGNTGAQMGGWYRKEIKSLADMKGLKFRVGGFGGKVLEPLGVVPQNIPGGEIYQSLEKGTIDAAEWVGPYDDLKLGSEQSGPHYHFPGFWGSGSTAGLVRQTKRPTKVCPASTKAALWSALRLTPDTDMQAKYDYKNPAALETLIGSRR
jgi:TRAP-type mannitol/chloroaromatic compound transport system substrate-binding protein